MFSLSLNQNVRKGISKERKILLTSLKNFEKMKIIYQIDYNANEKGDINEEYTEETVF